MSTNWRRQRKNETYNHVVLHGAIESLQYGVNITRPHIAFTINVLSHYLNNPGEEYWKAVKWVLRYLRGTTSKNIVFDGKKNYLICSYSDSDYVGCEDKFYNRICVHYVWWTNIMGQLKAWNYRIINNGSWIYSSKLGSTRSKLVKNAHKRIWMENTIEQLILIWTIKVP